MISYEKFETKKELLIMNTQSILNFLKTNSLNNNTQLRKKYEALKTDFCKKGASGDEACKLALFIAAKNTMKKHGEGYNSTPAEQTRTTPPSASVPSSTEMVAPPMQPKAVTPPPIGLPMASQGPPPPQLSPPRPVTAPGMMPSPPMLEPNIQNTRINKGPDLKKIDKQIKRTPDVPKEFQAIKNKRW